MKVSQPMNVAHAAWADGYLKYRLAHSDWGSFVVIDAVFTQAVNSAHGWAFHMPSFYGPPRLVFDVPNESGGPGHGYSVMMMNANLAGPRGTSPIAVNLVTKSTDIVKTYSDGSCLAACRIQHDVPLQSHRSGFARRVGEDFELKLFHHTKRATEPLIRQSGHFLGSQWNLQGTRKLTNVSYVYFTALSRIRGEDDLQRIAMSSQDVLVLRGMAAIPGFADPVTEMRVLRSDTASRSATLSYWVPVELIAPNHLLKFSPMEGAYYESVLPEVVRVGLKPGQTLSITNDRVFAEEASRKNFQYVICGDASSRDGLQAPYDEEETKQIIHLEDLQAEDIFTFWQNHLNSDQVSGKSPELRMLELRGP